MATQDRSPSSIIGQQWSVWTDLLTSLEEIDEEEEKEKKNEVEKSEKEDKNSSDSMRLGIQDMGIFGFCPSREEFNLVVCEKCKLLVKPQALKQHIESRHGPTNLSNLGNVPASALNSELAKHMLMALPAKSAAPAVAPVPTPAVSASSAPSRSAATFKPASSGRPPTKDTLKQVPLTATARESSAPKLGVSMKINKVKKAGHRVAMPLSTATATSTITTFSNPVVKVEKLDKISFSSAALSTSAMLECLDSPPDLSNSLIKTEPPSLITPSSFKISTLGNGPFKTAISLTTPSIETFTSSSPSPSMVSMAHLVTVTKASADTPISAHTVTTFVSSATKSKPLVIGPVMTSIGSSSSVVSMTGMPAMTAKPIAFKPSKKPKDPNDRKCLPCKDREYDPDKHCGTRIPETGKSCTRSLTCKTHALSLRRAVQGRSKPFDELLKEHKAAKDLLLKAKAASQAAAAANAANGVANRVLVTSTGMSPNNLKIQHSSPQVMSITAKNILSSTPITQRITVPSSGLPTNTTFVKPRAHMNVFHRVSANATLPSAITVKEETINRQDPSRLSQPSTSSERQRSDSQDSKPDQSFTPHHPKPIAVCQFGGRMNDRGCFLFSRKTDYVRAAFLSALERQLNPPPHKKLCVESNLPKESQSSGISKDPYEFNILDTSGSHTTVISQSGNLVNIPSKHHMKQKSKLPASPVGASNSITLSTLNLSSAMSLPSSTFHSSSVSSFTQPNITMATMASATPGLALNWSVKPNNSIGLSRASSATLTSPAILSATSGNNPVKRKRSGSSGGNNLIAVASNNGTLTAMSGISVSSANASLANAISQQTGLTGIISSGNLNSAQAGNLIAIPSVNLTNAANMNKINAASLSNAKLTNSNTGNTNNSVHKNNNMFKDFSLVLTGIDSLNGQVVNISSAQLAELAASQGQTFLLNNLTSVGSSGTPTTTNTVTLAAASAPTPRPAKRQRASSSKSHQATSVSGMKMANSLEGYKLIPSNNVISSSGLPANTVLLNDLQGHMLTSVGSIGGNQTLVALTPSTAGSNMGHATGPSQVLCGDSSSGQILTSSLVNGAGQTVYEKLNTSRVQHSSVSKSHQQHHHGNHHNHHKVQQHPQHQGMSLGNVIHTASPSLVGPMPTGSTAQLCSNQAIFKSGGGNFQLAKNNMGKLTVQPVSLTFPISMNQQGLTTLGPGKPSQLQQQQQQQMTQQQPHTLLVQTSGAADDPSGGVRVASKNDLHLQSQISSTSSGNLIS